MSKDWVKIWKSDNSFAKVILDRVFRTMHNFTHKSFQACLSLRRYTANMAAFTTVDSMTTLSPYV